MKKIIIAALFVLSGSLQAMAANCPDIQSKSNVYSCTEVVYNDSGSNLTSGTVVIWDNDDTEFDRTGYPYVTTVSAADSPWTAGVVKDGLCLANNLCEIITYGFAWTQAAEATATMGEDTLVGTSATTGMVDDFAAGANTCSLGMLIEKAGKVGGSDTGVNGQIWPVWVDVDCN